MTDDRKDGKLRVVDEPATEEVFRLGKEKEAPVVVERLPLPSSSEPIRRLQSGVSEDLSRRSHEPDIDSIIEPPDEAENPEEAWRGTKDQAHGVPYGWFVLIVLLLVATVAMAVLLQQQRERTEKIDLREVSIERLGEEREEEFEAERLLDEVNRTVGRFFAADSVDELLPLVRDPRRVEPLMREWYASKPPVPRQFVKLTVFHPWDIGGKPFWVMGCRTAGDPGDEVELIAEQVAEDAIRIDWEAMVCYQPMPWDRYVKERPEGRPMDFRVILQRDRGGWYSHEFRDETEWMAYRLEARDAEEFLIGYVRRGSEVEEAIEQMEEEFGVVPLNIVLRLNIPEGTTSPRGVVVEKLVSRQWAVVEAPTDSP